MMSTQTVARPVPCDIDAERLVLGAVLRDPSLIADARPVLRPEHFFTLEHGEIYRAILAVADKLEPSLDAVRNGLAASGRLSSIGGADYLVQLAMDCGFDVSNFAYNVKIVRNYHAGREGVSIGEQMVRDFKRTPAHEVPALLGHYQQVLYDLDIRSNAAAGLTEAGQAVDEAIQHADRVALGEVKPGLMTGFGDIDRALGGIQPGDLVTLAADTSVGKTAFALAIAANVAQARGAVLYVSGEMDSRALAYRLLQAHSKIPAGRLRTSNLAPEELEARETVAADIAQWQLAFHARTATVADVGIRARQLAVRWRRPLDLIVVDYLQLMKPTIGDTRAQQIGGIAWGLKQLAMDIGTPVLMLSQLNREGIKGKRPPSIHALKESGDIENHSNSVLLLHRPESPDYDTDKAMLIWAKIAKARDGRTTPWPTKTRDGLRLRFHPEITRFEPPTRL